MAFIDYLTVVTDLEKFDVVAHELRKVGRLTFTQKKAVVRLSRSARVDEKILGRIADFARKGLLHVSRIDLAQDYEPVDIKRIESVVPESLTTGKFTGKSGSTLYIGSRSSAFMARIYDKSAEVRRRGVQIPPTQRLEFEVKRKDANAIFLLCMQEHGVDAAFAYLLRRFKLDSVFNPDAEAVEVELIRKASPIYRHLSKATINEIILSLKRDDGVAMEFLEMLLWKIKESLGH